MRAPTFRWGSEEQAGRPWGAWLLAAAVHLPLVWGFIGARPVDPVRYPPRLITLAPMEAEGREVRIPVPADVPLRSRGERRPANAVFSPPPPAPPRPLAERSESSATPPVAAGHRSVGRLGPGLGEGRLWVEPMPLPPRALAALVTRRSAQDMADSFVTAVVQAYLDSIAHDPDVIPLRAPSWVATVGGTKYGIDANHIYVAGLKIPTALLALLPLPSGGNQRPIDHSIESMAYSLRVAGARSANLDEFRQAVRELRKKKEQEREYERNRGATPGDTLVGHRDP